VENLVLEGDIAMGIFASNDEEAWEDMEDDG